MGEVEAGILGGGPARLSEGRLPERRELRRDGIAAVKWPHRKLTAPGATRVDAGWCG